MSTRNSRLERIVNLLAEKVRADVNQKTSEKQTTDGRDASAVKTERQSVQARVRYQLLGLVTRLLLSSAVWSAAFLLLVSNSESKSLKAEQGGNLQFAEYHGNLQKNALTTYKKKKIGIE